MPEDVKLSQIGSFSAAASIQGTSLSRSMKTLSDYLRLLFPDIIYCQVHARLTLCKMQLSLDLNETCIRKGVISNPPPPNLPPPPLHGTSLTPSCTSL